jgi:hypothetical protein
MTRHRPLLTMISSVLAGCGGTTEAPKVPMKTEEHKSQWKVGPFEHNNQKTITTPVDGKK